MSADPISIAGGLNLYLYAGADPVNAVDLLGLLPASLERAFIDMQPYVDVRAARDWWLNDFQNGSSWRANTGAFAATALDGSMSMLAQETGETLADPCAGKGKKALMLALLGLSVLGGPLLKGLSKATGIGQRYAINNMSQKARNHILRGEIISRGRRGFIVGGGHSWTASWVSFRNGFRSRTGIWLGQGTPLNNPKTMFPWYWSDNKILASISDVMGNPNAKRISQWNGAREAAIEAFEGVTIQAVKDVATSNIITGFPL